MCHHDDIKLIFKILIDEKFSIYKCCNCFQIFANPWIMDSEEGYDYSQLYFDQALSTGIITESCAPVKENIMNAYYEATSLIRKWWRSGTIADIGCGIGLSSLAIQCLKIPVASFEKNEKYVAVANNKFKLNIKNFDIYTYNGNKFDFAVLNAVLEHVHSPKSFLNAIKKNILNYHGLLIVTVPNIESSQMISIGRSFYNLDPGHVWHFSERTLNNLMEECGYILLEYHRHSFNLDGVDSNVEYYMNHIRGENINIYGSIAGIWISI